MTTQNNIEAWLAERAELERGLKIAKANFPAMAGRNENETVAECERALASVDAALTAAKSNADRT